MRRLLLSALTTGLLVPTVLLGGSPALAHPDTALSPALPADLTYTSTDNVDHLGRFPEHSGTGGGAPSADGKRFYLTDPRGVHVYDTSDPKAPFLLGSLPLFQQQTGAALAQEDPDTDGRILLVDGATTAVGLPKLHVVDVSDPKAMRVRSVVDVTDHTWTCVTLGDNGCAYAYGREGFVVDLRNPDKPVKLASTWRQHVGMGQPGTPTRTPYTHDLTEIRPGLVLSAGARNVLMDTRDPERPVLLNTLDQSSRFPSLGYHSAEWAQEGRDDFLVLGTEIAPPPAAGLPAVTGNTAGSDCQGEESVIETWDARAVRDAVEAYFAGTGTASQVRAAKFTKIDAYDVSGRGLFLTGDAPGHVLYCAHWMEPHPAFANGGLLTVSYYDRGTRFVEVGKNGKMTEKGWITAAEGYSGSSQWVDDSVVYVMDYRRGLEVVQLDRTVPAKGVRTSEQDVIALGSVALAATEQRDQSVAYAAVGVLALLLANVTVLRRRRA